MRKAVFYPKLAWQNLSRNKKFYLPYILTCIATISMFYIMCFLQNNSATWTGNTGATLGMILMLGIAVIGIFSVIFLFYTNSFLMKRRQKELGLYNILGMGKRNIAWVLFFETAYVSLISLTLGLILGVIMSKLALLFLTKLISFSAPSGIAISVYGMLITVCVFTGIFLLILFSNLIRIRLSNPVELLRGGNVGEKEPKTKWILAILGIIALGAGYYIAIVTDEPLKAISLFFVAVILVIIGTYLLFTASSIAILKRLKANHKYYYQTNHFIPISGMVYRMKQNAVGLANICILATMVLVMVSGTVSLYFGAEDSLRSQFPSEISITVGNAKGKTGELLQDAIEETVAQCGLQMTDIKTEKPENLLHGGYHSSDYKFWYFGFEVDGSSEQKLDCYDAVQTTLYNLTPDEGSEGELEYDYMYIDSRESNREMCFTMYGGFLFLGLFLGLCFLMATVLIIYYKQLSEGYADKERFAIMRKVGLSDTEIKKSIRSQILVVFFLPLGMAVLHICFAFKMITKLLLVLWLTNVKLFALCTLGTVILFAIIYGIVYALTAKTYYKVVSE